MTDSSLPRLNPLGHIDAIGANQLNQLAHETGDLLIWTIYDHPLDAPDIYVARPHSIKEQQALPLYLAELRLDELRDILASMGLTCLPRAGSDDPVIVESWV